MSLVPTYNTYITDAPTTTEAPRTETTLATGSFMFNELSERFK